MEWMGKDISEVREMLTSFWPSLKAVAAQAWIEAFKSHDPVNVKKAIRDIYRHRDNTYHPGLNVVLEQVRGLEPKKIDGKRVGMKGEEFLKKKGAKRLSDLL